MHPVAAAMLGLTLAIGAGVAWFGNRLERAAAAAIGIYLILTPALETLRVQNFRAGLAGLELVLFLVFWLAAEKSNRWWLTAAAGFQLISVISFLVPFLLDNVFVLTGVTLRLGAWALVLTSMAFGVWEARLHRTYKAI